MTEPFFILSFASLYGIGISGGKTGRIAFVSAILLHLIYIVYRSVYLGHLAVTEKSDILLLTGLLASIYLFLLSYWGRLKSLDYLLLLPVGFCILGLFQERIDTINPNMNSPWFYLYMILFVLGFSLLSGGSALGILYLRELDPLIERLQYKFTLAGWLVFSFSLIAGSVWFFLAYGVYWLWTAKELWITIVWFYYAFYLHGRLINSLRGQIISEIGVAGLLLFIFAYLGVTPILGSPWTQF